VFRKVVVYFDGSPKGKRVVKRAILLCSQTKGELFMVSAISPLDELDVGFGEFERDLERGISSLVEDARELGVKVEVRMLFGSPEDALIKVIDAEKPDLVVLPLIQTKGGFFGRGEYLHTKLLNIYSDEGLAVMVIP
jgi:nucleotide-binding universal stress UspA family protein